jgi:hypothetical protein
VFVVLRHRFVTAYAILALAVAGVGVATWRASTAHRPSPLAPEAVVLVENFLGAVQQGDLVTACRLFSGYPACNPSLGTFPLKTYEVLAAQPAVDGVDVPARLNGQYALFSMRHQIGGYQIADIVADPSPEIQAAYRS